MSYLPSDCMFCRKCGFSGHFARACSQHCRWCHEFMKPNHYALCKDAPDCYNCGKKGHIQPDCPQKKRKREEKRESRPGKVRYCYNCGKEGHSNQDCTQTEPTCFNCARTGHHRQDCTQTEPTCLDCAQIGHQRQNCPNDKVPQQVQLEITMPQLYPIILLLVQKLCSGEIKDPLIEHIPYKSVVNAVGDANTFAQMALNVIDSRVLALQGGLITVEKLDRIRLSQSQETDPWPRSHGGYCDYVTDVRDKKYWRGYVGQASVLAERIPQHCREIRKGSNSALHYHIITKASAAGFRYGNFLRLWIIQFPGGTDIQTKEAFENILEMTFTRAYQTLAPSILVRYFGPCPEGEYASVGLNIIPPLMQGRELAPTVRGQFCKLLEESVDQELKEWPTVRALQKHQPKASEKCMLATRLYPKLTQEEIIKTLHHEIQREEKFANILSWQVNEKIPWAPLENKRDPVNIKTWFGGLSDWLLKSNSITQGNLAVPIGTMEASIGIVVDSVPCHDYGDNVFLPWGLKESGFTDTNSLIWISNFRKYKLIPGTFQVGPLSSVDTEMLSTYAQDLIRRSNLRVILLCGELAEKVVLTENDQSSTLALNLQGVNHRVWIRLKDHAIERIFVKSPAPLTKLWSNKGPTAVSIGALFRFVAAVINVKLFPAFYQSALTLALIIRGLDDERRKRIEPLTPELEKINPTLRIWLEKLGFKRNDDIQRLTGYAEGSLRLGLLILSKILPRQPSQHSRLVPQSRIRRRGVIPPQVIANVRTLFKEVQNKALHLPETKSDDSVREAQKGATQMHGTEDDDAAKEARNGARLPATEADESAQACQSSEDAGLVDEDVLLEAVRNGSVTIQELDAKERNDRPPNGVNNNTDRVAYRKHLQLLTGYYYRGHEERKGEYSTYQFNINHATFRIHEAPPNCPRFFVKAELTPSGERHPNAYATNALDDDPGIQFALRVSIHDDHGEESFVQYASSKKWQAIAIANSIVDGLAGDSLEEICRRKRRFAYVDTRIKNVHPDLVPFVNGAYRCDDDSVGLSKDGSMKAKRAQEQIRSSDDASLHRG